VHSLHDPTEGGILNGVWELAEAAGVGAVIWEEEVPVAEETRVVCEALDIDPLKLMGSGALLIVVELEYAGEMVLSLNEMGIEATVIGTIRPVEEGRVLVKKDGGRIDIEAVDQDEVYRILGDY
jgi:hydrogenase maturation factor